MTTTTSENAAKQIDPIVPSKAQSYVSGNAHGDDVVYSQSRSIAKLVATNAVQSLGTLNVDIPQHRRISLNGKTVAVAHSVDAAVVASTSDNAKAVPDTLDLLLAAQLDDGQGAAQLTIGVLPCDFFLGVYASKLGYLPEIDDGHRRLARPTTRSTLDLIASLMANRARFTTPSKAANALIDGSTNLAYLPFGDLPTDIANLRAAPLRATQDGAPAAVLYWSGLSWNGTAKDPIEKADLGLDLSMENLDDGAHDAAVWLLDDFTPTATHASLLETIAAGVVICPLDLAYVDLRDAIEIALAPLVAGDATVEDTMTVLEPHL